MEVLPPPPDKTLTTEGAPADAKAVGDKILDADGNVLFYSKSKVDEMLAGKLDATPATSDTLGGIKLGDGFEIAEDGEKISPFFREKSLAVNNNLNESTNSGWYAYKEDTANRPEDGHGVVITTDIGGYVWPIQFAMSSSYNRIAVRKSENNVWTDWNVFTAGVVASGPNYVRFGDGTQICFSGLNINGNGTYVAFPVPFVTFTAATVSNNANIGTDVNLAVGAEGANGFYIYTDSSHTTAKGFCHYIAIGRWK